MSRVQNQVRQHNDTYRNVQHKYSYSSDKFLSQSQGNLLINGGTKEQRLQVLINAIIQKNQRSSTPIVVFGSDGALQQALIESAQTGKINRLYMCTSPYRNYDFFAGMNINQIVDYFSSVALEKGFRDTAELDTYIGSFLRILKTQVPLNLASIAAFSNNSDTDIANLARQYSTVDYETIISSIKSGITFRMLVAMTVNAFDEICDINNPTELNMVAIADQPCVIFVQIPYFNYELFSHYFIQAFKQLMHKQMTLVFDDSIMLNNKEFSDVLEIVKQRNNIEVINACENILSFSSEVKLNNYSRHIVFLNGLTSPSDLQFVLNSLGEYNHFEVTNSSGNTPHLLFSFLKTENKGITPYSRAKLLLEQEDGNEAVLRGYNGSEIMVVKHLN